MKGFRSSLRSRILFAGLLATFALPASAALIEVDAKLHSLSGGAGAGLATGIVLSAGDRLVTSADFDDLWSAGGSPRTSNANGLGPDNAVCPSCDDGSVFGPYNFGGNVIEFGSLVGKIGAGGFFKMGVSFDAIVADAGELLLFYWDSNAGDNTGSILVNVEVNPNGVAVPEPATVGLLGLGLVAMGLRRRRQS